MPPSIIAHWSDGSDINLQSLLYSLWFAVRHTDVDQKYFYFYAAHCQTQQTGNDLVVYELTIQPVCEVVRKKSAFFVFVIDLWKFQLTFVIYN